MKQVDLSLHFSDAGKATKYSQNLKIDINSVAVVLGYFNGKKYISDQLSSIFNQTHTSLHIFLCDDKSPEPFDINKLTLSNKDLNHLSFGIRDNNVGFTYNFLYGLASIKQPFEYFAFSDQDDIWYADKLERAMDKLSKIPKDVPALYCSRTEIVNDSCELTLGLSPLFKKQPSFANSLVQNIGGGNTMVFNKVAKNLIVSSLKNIKVVSHDWWCYQIITGAGGHIVYDSKPSLKYRQHPNNIVGENAHWRSRLTRISSLFKGSFRKWNETNINALAENKSLLATKNVRTLNDFIEARQSHLLKRIKLFKQSGIYRQTFLGNLGLILAILLNKV